MPFWQPDPTFDITLQCHLSGCLPKQLIFLDMVSIFQKYWSNMVVTFYSIIIVVSHIRLEPHNQTYIYWASNLSYPQYCKRK